MNDPKQYIKIDEHGVMRVGDRGVLLDSIVASFEQGLSAETIRQQYPSLSLEEVYGAITCYLANCEELNEYLARQDALWQELRAKSELQPPPVVKRLRALRQRQMSEAS